MTPRTATNPNRRSASIRAIIATACFAIAALITARYPVTPILLATALLIYCAALWRWPSLWLLVIPAVLPALDFTPWTGWLLIGEYDLFALATIGVLVLRAPPTVRDLVIPGPPGIAISLSVVTYLIGVMLGLTSLLGNPRQSDLLYLRPDNALRLANGFVLALMLLPFLRERRRAGQDVVTWFAVGMLVGLILVAMATITERALFPGLFNFVSDYRVVATFSSMHLGGGHIGAYIAMTVPFLIICLIKPRPLTMLLMLVVVTAASYSLVVTFARTAYVAAMVSILVVSVGWIAASSQQGRNARFTMAMPILLVMTVSSSLFAAALDAGIMSQRFTTLSPDLAGREENWTGGLQLRDDSVSAILLGMGLGTYPRAVLGRRRDGNIPSNFVVKHESGQNFLSMTAGVPIYFGQKVSIEPDQTYQMSMDVRSPDDKAAISVLLCEKILLYSDNCRAADFKPKRPADWELFSATISTVGMDQLRVLGVLRRPIELSLFDAVPKSTIEIKNVALTGPAGRDVIANGDFTQGVERWYFTDDNHLVWRMEEQYLMILFENGVLGLLSFFTLVVTAAWGAWRAVRRGDRAAAAVAASLAAFLCSGLFDYLLVAPRIAALFYLVCFVGLTIWHDNPAQPHSA